MPSNTSSAEEEFKRACDLYLEKRYSQAKRQLIENLNRFPNYGPSHLLLGQIYFFSRKPNYGAAVQEFQKVTSICPAWQEGFQWLGIALKKIGKVEEALTAFHNTILLSPEDSRPYIDLGILFTEKEQYAEAIEMLRKGLELKPYCTEADVRLFLAEALMKNGQLSDARSEWRRILEIEPGYPSGDLPQKEAAKMLAKYPESVGQNALRISPS